MKSFHLAPGGTRIRFLIGGAINTAITYGIYLALRMAIDYQWAFLLAYLLGIAFSYFFNAILVFRTQLNWTNALSFPLVYAIQYAASAGILWALVETLAIDERVAPIAVTVVMIPLTFFLMKFVFRIDSKTKL